jgi:hypothetical protein
VKVFGIDFTCAPRKAKAITVACGKLKRNVLAIQSVHLGHGSADSTFPSACRASWCATSAGPRTGLR